MLPSQIGISPTLMGMTFGAIGTTTPDAYMSFLVARSGHGEMAVSNALGSNVFDLLFALGVPWFLYTIAMGSTEVTFHTGSPSLCF